MALSNTFLWDFFNVFVCQTFLLEQRGQLNQTAGQHHAATVIIGEVFPFQNASYISESGNKGRRRSREREREREQVTEIIQLICLCYNLPSFLFPTGCVEAGDGMLHHRFPTAKQSSSRDSSLGLKRWNPRQ